MSLHLQKEIDYLKKQLLSLCSMTENSLWQAVKSIKKQDAELAEKVAQLDLEIDQTEVRVEEECLKILALHQPVAIDLRFIITALKLSSDLERIGDLAVNIAERSLSIISQNAYDEFIDFEEMAEKTQNMVKMSIDSLVELNSDLATKVCQADDEIDAINRMMYEQIKERMKNRPENIDNLIDMMSISRHLERIADHATNIAEDVIYMVKGDIVRHNPAS